MGSHQSAMPQKVALSALGASVGLALSCCPAPYLSASNGNPFGGFAAMSDAALSEQRGGFISPEGVRIAIGYTMETHVNGALVMRSHVTVAQTASPGPQYTGYSGIVTLAETPSLPSPGVSTSHVAHVANQVQLVQQETVQPGRVVFSIERGGTSIQAATPQAVSAPFEPPVDSIGSTSQPLSTAMVMLDTADFESTLSAGGYHGHYAGPDVDIVHQVSGGVPAAIISNTANNRLIEHSTVISLDLSQIALPPSATLSSVHGSVRDGLSVFRP